ncbi:MAG: transglutaminase-like domain-containing protein, partial [Ignavibacteria bacterium]|nr:transglutaminase-like domain-containing protein [Ignavibacteria bacterium]
PLPEFKYQTSNNANLAELRKAFNLDSIAGKGNEVSKILNLLHWIHNLVEHDGSNGNPVVKNALSMINECKNGKRGLNCRGLAIVLNECYLSMGIKSRFVTCLPKDSLKVDSDCHVINMVYSEILKKWLWIDPTFDAYVMNEKGELSSIEEVRERLINGRMLILNPDANWNRRSSQTKENYLYQYMAKNLYMLECPVSSAYNLETKESGKITEYIRLLPLDYFDQKPDVQTSENKEYNSKTITYMTNNAGNFWKAPAK